MKKILTLISVITLITGFSHKTSAQTPSSDPIVESTLTGTSQTQAKIDVQDFASTYITSNPVSLHLNTQIWISEPVLEAIKNLLVNESKTGIVKPDGVRIYFASTPPTSSTIREDALVVVSTYFSGIIMQDTAHVKVHTDYFEHSKKVIDSISMLVSRNGIKITHYSDTTNGALLYKICNCDIQQPCIVTSGHDIKRSRGEALVQHFQGMPCNAYSEWFDIDMISNLVKEMKDPSENDDGIRIYYARNDIRSGPNKDETEFVIVTTQSINGISKDYFDCKHVPFEGKKTPGQDNGEQCPNNCAGTSMP
ncbi:MAG: hypothetical protein JST50_04020 [Bacteroidetes bacterium]|jgi:hypothetical protein|nr:hypothetical protein [Bacteroidota bacterium]